MSEYSPPLEYSPLIGPSPSERKYPGQREKGSWEAVVVCAAADTDVEVSTVICNLHGSSLLPKGRAKECKNIKCPNKTFEDICDQQRWKNSFKNVYKLPIDIALLSEALAY